jgi:hypothetical protein
MRGRTVRATASPPPCLPGAARRSRPAERSYCSAFPVMDFACLCAQSVVGRGDGNV